MRKRPHSFGVGRFCSLVPAVGLEPTRSFLPGILSPVRLPFRHAGRRSRASPLCLCALRKRATSGDVARLVEAPSGFEPENEGFADLCLTSWLWCHGLRLSRALTIYQKAGDLATDFRKLGACGLFFACTQLFGKRRELLAEGQPRGATHRPFRTLVKESPPLFRADDRDERVLLPFVN